MYLNKKLQGFQANMARDPFFPRFSCVLERSTNPKRFFSVFKVSLIMMRKSDSASADVEMWKPHKELILSGASD